MSFRLLRLPSSTPPPIAGGKDLINIEIPEVEQRIKKCGLQFGARIGALIHGEHQFIQIRSFTILGITLSLRL